MKLSEALDKVWQLADKAAESETDKEAVNMVHDFFINYLLDEVEDDEVCSICGDPNSSNFCCPPPTSGV